MLKCQVFCSGTKSGILYCLYYGLPSAGEGPRSCLVGGPLAQQVQHTVVRLAQLVYFNGLHGLVVHTQEGTKVLPVCIQLVVESFNNVCRQRRGGQDVVLLCSKQIGVQQTHRPCLVVEEGGVWQHLALVPQRTEELLACQREGRGRTKHSLLVTFYNLH